MTDDQLMALGWAVAKLGLCAGFAGAMAYSLTAGALGCFASWFLEWEERRCRIAAARVRAASGGMGVSPHVQAVSRGGPHGMCGEVTSAPVRRFSALVASALVSPAPRMARFTSARQGARAHMGYLAAEKHGISP